MKNVFLILLICSYILAFVVNFMPALKHPDLSINMFDLFVSLVYAAFLLIYARKGTKMLQIFSMIGIFSGVIVFLIKTMENVLFEYAILDAIASIQYPLYLIYTIPLFGGNIYFDIGHAAYSLLLSIFYLFVFGLAVYYKKKNH